MVWRFDFCGAPSRQGGGEWMKDALAQGTIPGMSEVVPTVPAMGKRLYFGAFFTGHNGKRIAWLGIQALCLNTALVIDFDYIQCF